MRLVACAHCHTQFDVTAIRDPALRCHCGMLILIGAQKGRVARIVRCGQCGAPWSEGATSCTYCGGVIDPGAELPLICPECYAQNPDASRFCRGCGLEFRPEPLRREASDTLCPGCNRDGQPNLLVRRELRGFWISECPHCHGLWVAKRDFEQLVNRTSEEQTRLAEPDAAPVPVGAQGSIRYARCPECDLQMLRHNFETVSGVIVDRCNRHGVWLDANELEQIARFLASGGLARARELRLDEREKEIELAQDRERRVAASMPWGQPTPLVNGLAKLFGV